MTARIAFVASFPASVDFAREMAPPGFGLVVASPRSPDYDMSERRKLYRTMALGDRPY